MSLLGDISDEFPNKDDVFENERPIIIDKLIDLYQNVSSSSKIEIINFFWTLVKYRGDALNLYKTNACTILFDAFLIEDLSIVELIKKVIFEELMFLNTQNIIDESILEKLQEVLEEALDSDIEEKVEICEEIKNTFFESAPQIDE